MNTKLISPKAHAIIDYALVGSLLTLPSLLGFNKKVKKIYAAEAITLFVYVALTNSPAAIKPIIPFRTHGKIDPFNVLQFALQTGLKPLRKDKNAMMFNIAFTLVAGLTVLLTDWEGRIEKDL